MIEVCYLVTPDKLRERNGVAEKPEPDSRKVTVRKSVNLKDFFFF